MRPNAFRRGLLTVHLWLGLILALPFVAIGLTGSILLVQREWVAQVIPSPTATGERQTLQHIIDASASLAPEGARMGRVEFRGGQPIVVQFQTGGRPQRNYAAYVDPVSLESLSPTAEVGRGPFIQSLVQLHEFLWLPPIMGLKVVGWMGVAMTFMGITGLILWWPRPGQWRNALLMRRGARGLRFHLDFHHVVGFWGSALLLILSVSGLYLTFTETVSAVARAVLPNATGVVEPAPGYVHSPGPADADIAVAIANAAVLRANAVGIQMPDRAGRPIVVYMDSEGLGPKTPPIMVTVNPETSEIGYIDDPRQYSVRDQVLNWQYALHFALGFPLLWKALVFVSGLLPLGLAITGVSIWWLKRRAKHRAKMPIAAAGAEAITQPAE